MKKQKGGLRVFVPNRSWSTIHRGTFLSTEKKFLLQPGRINRTVYRFFYLTVTYITTASARAATGKWLSEQVFYGQESIDVQCPASSYDANGGKARPKPVGHASASCTTQMTTYCGRRSNVGPRLTRQEAIRYSDPSASQPRSGQSFHRRLRPSTSSTGHHTTSPDRDSGDFREIYSIAFELRSPSSNIITAGYPWKVTPWKHVGTRSNSTTSTDVDGELGKGTEGRRCDHDPSSWGIYMTIDAGLMGFRGTVVGVTPTTNKSSVRFE